jgi:AcrR family transcriptional regulator
MTATRDLRPRATPRQARSRETVDAILQAAAQVFERHGYAAGTTNRIAERAGVSIGSLYQYFPGKDAILVELTRRHIREGERRLAPLLAELEAGRLGLEVGLERLVGGLVDLHRDSPRLHRVLFEEAPHPEELLDELRRLEDRAAAVLERWLSSLAEVRIADVRVGARLVTTVAEAVAHRLVIHPDCEVAAERWAVETVRLLVAYLERP